MGTGEAGYDKAGNNARAGGAGPRTLRIIRGGFEDECERREDETTRRAKGRCPTTARTESNCATCAGHLCARGEGGEVVGNRYVRASEASRQ